MNVVSFGGGTNSTAMIIGMYLHKIPIDLILFADTGGEQPGSVLCLMNRMRYCGTHAEEEPRRQQGDYCQYCGHRLREIGRERFCNNVNCRNRYVNV